MGFENLLGLVKSVELQKVQISWARTYDDITKDSVAEHLSLMFNPTEYSLEQLNQISETHIPGLDSPVLQFVHGQGRTLTMQLFIDTTEPKQLDDAPCTDARLFVGKISDLMKVQGESHAPPLCRVDWGSLRFIGVLAQAKARYLLFNYKGEALRATVDVTFKEYRPIGVQLTDPPRSSPDRTKVRPLRQGETLSALAAQEYGDPGQWRLIARRNRITDPRRLAPGTLLVIPPVPAEEEAL